jgi:hypothetical protein
MFLFSHLGICWLMFEYTEVNWIHLMFCISAYWPQKKSFDIHVLLLDSRLYLQYPPIRLSQSLCILKLLSSSNMLLQANQSSNMLLQANQSSNVHLQANQSRNMLLQAFLLVFVFYICSTYSVASWWSTSPSGIIDRNTMTT